MRSSLVVVILAIAIAGLAIAQQPPAKVDPKPYVLTSEETIRVSVHPDKDLGCMCQVRPDGKITVPLIGDQQAAGLTTKDLKDKLQKAFAEYRSVEVTVMVMTVSAKSAVR